MGVNETSGSWAISGKAVAPSIHSSAATNTYAHGGTGQSMAWDESLGRGRTAAVGAGRWN